MLENEGVTDGRVRRVGGAAIAGQISTIPEMRSLNHVPQSHPWEVSKPPKVYEI